MAKTADYITFDAFDRPPGGPWLWSARVKKALKQPIPGLRAAMVSGTSHSTYSWTPSSFIPPGRALFAAWDSPEAAIAAFRGPLAVAVKGAGRYSLDGEVARVRLEEPDHTWHGWSPSDQGAKKLRPDEPMAAVVHNLVRPTYLYRFARNVSFAAVQARFHPGHCGSATISAKMPWEHTTVSLWKSMTMARDYAYKPGAHMHGMNHTRENNGHTVGVFLQVRILASSGSLGIDTVAFPDLPPAART